MGCSFQSRVRLAVMLGLVGGSVACIRKGSSSAPRTVTVSGQAFQAELKNVMVYAKGDTAHALRVGGEAAQKAARNLATSQFRFVYGNFTSQTDLKPYFPSEPEILRIEPVDDNTTRVIYNVAFEAHGKHTGHSVEVALPVRGDLVGLVEFSKRLGSNCGVGKIEGTDAEADEERAQHLFFFFDPQAWSCPVRNLMMEDGDGGDSELGVVTATVQLTPREGKSTLRAPEYDKIWADGKLKSTILVAPTGESEDAQPGTVEAGLDAGLATFNMLFRKLQKEYPESILVAEDETGLSRDASGLVYSEVLGSARMPVPGRNVNYFRFTKEIAPGKSVEVSVGYAGVVSLAELSDSSLVKSRFQRDSQEADLLVYAGHSAFGSNTDVFNKWGALVPGHYSLVYINACWSLGYLLSPEAQQDPEGLRGRVEKMNGNAPWSRNVDFILNESTSNGYKASANVVAVLRALQGRDKSYLDILNALAQDARPVVLGEEDNPPWVAP